MEQKKWEEKGGEERVLKGREEKDVRVGSKSWSLTAVVVNKRETMAVAFSLSL